MDKQIQTELRAFINAWREKHDLKPSEVVEQLREAIEHYKPTHTDTQGK